MDENEDKSETKADLGMGRRPGAKNPEIPWFPEEKGEPVLKNHKVLWLPKAKGEPGAKKFVNSWIPRAKEEWSANFPEHRQSRKSKGEPDPDPPAPRTWNPMYKTYIKKNGAVSLFRFSSALERREFTEAVDISEFRPCRGFLSPEYLKRWTCLSDHIFFARRNPKSEVFAFALVTRFRAREAYISAFCVHKDMKPDASSSYLFMYKVLAALKHVTYQKAFLDAPPPVDRGLFYQDCGFSCNRPGGLAAGPNLVRMSIDLDDLRWGPKLTMALTVEEAFKSSERIPHDPACAEVLGAERHRSGSSKADRAPRAPEQSKKQTGGFEARDTAGVAEAPAVPDHDFKADGTLDDTFLHALEDAGALIERVYPGEWQTSLDLKRSELLHVSKFTMPSNKIQSFVGHGALGVNDLQPYMPRLRTAGQEGCKNPPAGRFPLCTVVFNSGKKTVRIPFNESKNRDKNVVILKPQEGIVVFAGSVTDADGENPISEPTFIVKVPSGDANAERTRGTATCYSVPEPDEPEPPHRGFKSFKVQVRGREGGEGEPGSPKEF